MNTFDKIILALAPERGVKRIAARMQADALRSYDAASKTSRATNWGDGRGSANTETMASLKTLVARARDLERNNPYSKRALEVIANNTIGTGIRPSHQGLTANQTKRVKDVWAAWAETTECDYNGQLDIYGLQRQVMHAVARDGECLVVQRVNRSKNATIPFQLQVLEADYLHSDFYPNFSVDSGNYVMQGVEFNKEGKRVAYWLYEQHPGDPLIYANSIQPVRVPADKVAHIYIQDRPGQVRGIPFGVSAMVKLRDFEEYQDAELVRRKVASLMVAFVADSTGSAIGGNNTKKFPSTMKPGSIMELNGGQQVTLSSPPSVDGYAEYSRVVLQSIAAAYGVTYEALTGNLGDVNFSSGRMGWLEFHRNVQDWQYNLIVPKFCDVTYQWFKDGVVIYGAAPKVPTKALWTAPRREMIDPVKEVKGLVDQVRAGFTSRSNVIRMLGDEPDEVLQEMIEDSKKIDSAKLMLDSDPRFDATRKQENPPTEQKNQNGNSQNK